MRWFWAIADFLFAMPAIPDEIMGNPLTAVDSWRSLLGARLWNRRLLVGALEAALLVLIAGPILALISGQTWVGFLLATLFSVTWTLYWNIDNGPAGEMRVPKFLGTYFGAAIGAGPDFFPFLFSIDRVPIRPLTFQREVEVFAGREGETTRGRLEAKIKYTATLRAEPSVMSSILWALSDKALDRIHGAVESIAREEASGHPLIELAGMHRQIRDAVNARLDDEIGDTLRVDLDQFNVNDITGAEKEDKDAVKRAARAEYDSNAAGRRIDVLLPKVQHLFDTLGGVEKGLTLDAVLKTAYIDALNNPELMKETVSTINVNNIGTITTAMERIATSIWGGWKPRDLDEFMTRIREEIRRIVREEMDRGKGAIDIAPQQ